MDLTCGFTLVKLAILAACFVAPALSKDPLESYELVYTWTHLDFAFPNETVRQDYLTSKKLIPENNIITGIKVTRDRVYLTIPRWRSGVPATLVSLPYDPEAAVQSEKHMINGPLLEAFPSWEMNAIGDCGAFQYVQSMEIDQFNRMWVVDVGHTAEVPAGETSCPPKLVLFDLETNQSLSTYVFPEEVVNHTNNLLNDIVVGCTSKDDCYAYLSDSGDAKIVVFSLAKNDSWFVSHPSMNADPSATNVRLEEEDNEFRVPVDGLALSQFDKGFDRLFYSPLSSLNVYAVPTSILKNFGSNDVAGVVLQNNDVKTLGSKTSQSDGMIVDAAGGLTYGLLGENAVDNWNTSYSKMTATNQILLVQSDIDLQWPDTFSIDEYGYVFTVTNRMHRFIKNKLDFKTTNFRIVKFYLGVKSYIHSASEPLLPSVNLKASKK